MPDLRAGSIAQIQDYSSRAGEKLIDILGKQIPTASILDDLVGKATRAWDSDQMAKAAAIQDTMIGLGHGPEKIKAALAGAGIRAGIVGSKELQDRYEEAEATRIAKEAHDNTMRTNALKEQSDALYADALNFISTHGTDAGAVWLNRNKDKLANNPLAAKLITDTFINKGIDISVLNPNAKSSYSDKISSNFKNYNQEKIDKLTSSLNSLEQQYRNEGHYFETNPVEATERTKLKSWISSKNKEFDYTGSDAVDFNNSASETYAKLVKAAPNLPPEKILMIMDNHLDAGGIMGDWFGFDQADVNLSAALKEAKLANKTWLKRNKEAKEVSKLLKVLQGATDNKTLTGANVAFDNLTGLHLARQDNKQFSLDESNNIYERGAKKLYSTLLPIIQAANEADGYLKLYEAQERQKLMNK